jgi:2-desacetyl-2-hydroxyethyl bacteriochlorophyllide A dehydrogenase
MLAVHFTGQGQVSLDEVPAPEPKGNDVVIRVRAAAICGTDRENLEGPGQATVPGHENAGEVVAVDRPTRVEVGDRVAVNCHVTCHACEHCLRGDLYFCDELEVIGFDRDGGYAEYVLVPEASCMPLPDDLSFEIGSLLVDMLGTSYRAVKRAGLLPGDRVAIWGAGPIGLGAAMVARRLGARVASLDLNEYRLDLARSLGAEITLNPTYDDVQAALRDWTEGCGLDAGFDCVGSEAAARQALDAVQVRGTVVIVGVSHTLTVDPWEQLICREATLLGTRSFNTAEYDEMIALVRRGLPVDQVVTHRYPLAEAEAAFDRFRTGQCGKIVLTG